MNQEEIWDEIAPSWADEKNKTFPGLVEFLKNKKGKILDLGCGSGRNFSAIKGEIYGIDFSKKMLEFASKKDPKANLIKSSVTIIPFKDNFFDAAIYIATLHCIEKENDRKKSLEEIYRVLKPKTQAFITVWSRNHERVKKQGDNIIPRTINNNKLLRFYYIYTKDELSTLLKKVGFKIISIKEEENIIATVEK
jgi:ubiquinone/menaquinone biosynthesis C-methylase UbiE